MILPQTALEDAESIGQALIEAAREQVHDGLIKAIDRWVIGRAILLLADRHASGHERLGLDVNLSGESIIDPTVMDFIASEVRNAPIDPTWLIFEVTETAAIANVDYAQGFHVGRPEPVQAAGRI